MKNHRLHYPAPSVFRLQDIVLFLLLFAGFCKTGELFGQQQIHHNFYQQNWQLLNPAASDRCFQIYKRYRNNPQWMMQGGVREQWFLSKIDGAPRTFFSSIQFKTDPANSVSSFSKFGLTVIRDQTDALSTTGVFGNLAFTIVNSKGNFFSLGASPGYVFTQLNGDKLKLIDPADPVVADFERHAAVEIPVGIYYHSEINDNLNEYYMGFSLPQGLGFNLTDVDSLGGWSRYKTPHFNTVFGFMKEFVDGGGQSNGILETSLWLRYVPGLGLPSIDLGSRFKFDTGWWVGGSFGTNLQGTIEGGFWYQPQKDGQGYRIGISYGAPPIGRYRRLGNTLEATLAYFWR